MPPFRSAMVKASSLLSVVVVVTARTCRAAAQSAIRHGESTLVRIVVALPTRTVLLCVFDDVVLLEWFSK